MDQTPPATPAPFGLLLDIDGPIASPVTRTLRLPELASDLTELAKLHIPIAFNTGRGTHFVDTVVLAKLTGIAPSAGPYLLACTEKGGVISHIHNRACTGQEYAPGLSMPPGFEEFCKRLVADKYSEHTFFDPHKDVMVSIESFAKFGPVDFHPVRDQIAADIAAWFAQHNYGYTWSGTEYAASDGSVKYRIDAHIIGIDIEPVEFTKALGASRIISAYQGAGVPTPQTWFTVGDAPSDYTMADWLNAHDYQVTHVDVRPVEHPQTPDYPVWTIPGKVNDDAGAVFIHAALQAAKAGDVPILGTYELEELH